MNSHITIILIAVLLLGSGKIANAQATPKMVAEGIISVDGENEFRLIVGEEGNVAMYSTARPGTPLYSIMVSSQQNGQWQEAQRLVPDGQFQSENLLEAFVATENGSMYFVSNAGADDTDNYDIWVLDISGESYVNARRLGTPINSLFGEWFPSVQNGKILFGSERPEGQGGIDIYSANLNGKALNAYPSPINSAYEDFDPVLANDGSFIIFSSNRPSDYKGTRLFVSFNLGEGLWSDVRNLGKELGPYTSGSAATLSSDEQTLYFTSRNPQSRRSGDIYSVDFQPILSQLKFEAGIKEDQ